MIDVSFKTPRVFLPLLQPARYKGAYGGRGSGKSYFFVDLAIEKALAWPGEAGEGLRMLCVREHQNSLKHSAKSLIERRLSYYGLGESEGFKVFNGLIQTPGGGQIVFVGMKDHTADSIKSYDGFHVAWTEEAQSVSALSIELLDPTIRWEDQKRGLESELWFSWNPRRETDAIESFLRGPKGAPPGTILVEANYHDNPFFPKVLLAKIKRDKNRDYDKYLHTWLGQYETISSAVVFKNWEVREFETPADAVFREGMDFGFAEDPSVLIRCFIDGSNLYIDQEVYGKHIQTEKLPDFMRGIPGANFWPIVADSSRPETIDYLKRHGFPNIEPSIKGAGSVEDGIEFLKSFDLIVHPRCVNTIFELKNYRFKVDKTRVDAKGNYFVLPVLEDKNNHVIDALRYACESVRRNQGTEFDYLAEGGNDMSYDIPSASEYLKRI